MTREEAIDVLKHNYPSSCFTDLCEAVEIAIQALSAQPAMTIEELKAEAKRQGYSLIKKQPYIALKKCPKCGKKPVLWVRSLDGKHKCDCDCVWIIEWQKTERQARIAWNEAIEKEMG